MESLSLKELKAQNADPEDAPVVEVVEEVEAEVKPEPEVVKPVAEVEETEAGEAEEEEGEQESWMQAEEAETSEDGKSGFVPNHGVAAVKRKLKAKLEKKDDELAQIRAELEAIKQGSHVQSAPKSDAPPRPKREDFDYDDDKYDAAIDEWNDKRFEAKLSSHSQVSQRQQQESQRAEQLKKTIDSHYDRAAQLVESGKVSEEDYMSADRNVRLALDEVFPGHGDSVADGLIGTLNLTGDHSEKVMFQVGRNPAVKDKLISLLRSDPNGLAASAYLGSLQNSIQSPTKRKSNAPRPAKPVNGEGAKGGPAGVIHKEYMKATDDPQARISLKRKAKAQGIDVRNW